MISAYVIPGLKYREPKKLDSEMVIESVCEYFNIAHEVLKKKNRKRERVIARQMICFFARKYTTLTLCEVGNLVGGKDHTTVIHSVNTVNDFIHIKDGRFLKMIFDIESMFIEKQKDATDKYQLTFN